MKTLEVCLVFGGLLAAVAGCNADLTLAETLQAVEESSQAEQALTFAEGSVEISTHFTIGQAVHEAAEELRAFIASQLPCAEITVAQGRLTIEYGVNPGNCVYHGQAYSGSHSIEVVSAQAGTLEVHHEWDALANARFSVSGTADVTWSAPEASRHVVHALTWTNLELEREVVGSGDRTQAALAGGILEGIEVNGSRQWTSPRGSWELGITGVEMRWVDPVPQAGSYELVTPFEGKSVTMTFQRLDPDTIEVVVDTGRRTYSFRVNSLGVITEE